MFNFKNKAADYKPKSKTREWIDAIVDGILSPRFRPKPKFRPQVTKSALHTSPKD